MSIERVIVRNYRASQNVDITFGPGTNIVVGGRQITITTHSSFVLNKPGIDNTLMFNGKNSLLLNARLLKLEVRVIGDNDGKYAAKIASYAPYASNGAGELTKGSVAFEELIAVINAALCCASLSIVPTVRHADYIGSRLEVLHEDDRAIVWSVSRASKAADYILSFLPDEQPSSNNPVCKGRSTIPTTSLR